MGVCYAPGDAMKAALIVAMLGTMLVPAQETSSLDAEGFIREWLVLAPIAIGGESGADEIDKDFINGEAAIKPKAGDKIAVANTQLTWTVHKAGEYFIDFL